VRLTLSIGVAQHAQADQDLSELMAQADQALYNAKNNGRNTVEIYESGR